LFQTPTSAFPSSLIGLKVLMLAIMLRPMICALHRYLPDGSVMLNVILQLRDPFNNSLAFGYLGLIRFLCNGSAHIINDTGQNNWPSSGRRIPSKTALFTGSVSRARRVVGCDGVSRHMVGLERKR
jgi:hypothetical protein